MKEGTTCFIFICLLFGTVQAQGQDLHTIWSHAVLGQQGLSAGYNWYICHDSEGFVWASSLAGLNRFDGHQIKQYHPIPGDTTSLFEEQVYSDFFEDNSKDIWFSTPNAIHCYKRKHDNFRRYKLLDENHNAIPGDYTVNFLEKDRFLWVKADTNIYRMDIKNPARPVQKITSSKQFKCEVGLGEGGSVSKLYMYGTNKGVEIHLVEEGKLRGIRKHFDELLIREIIHRSDTAVWVAGNLNGVFRWNPTKARQNIKQVGGILSGASCAMIALDNKHLLILAVDLGIFLLDETNHSCREISYGEIGQEKFELQNFKGGWIDKQNNLWVPDITSGFRYANLDKTKFKSLPLPPAVNPNKNITYWAIEEDLEGNIWQATSHAGVFVSDKNGKLIHHLLHKPSDANSMPSNMVADLVYDSTKNRIWVASPLWLAWCSTSKPGFFHKIIPGYLDSNLRFKHLHLTRNGQLLVTTEHNGIFEIKESGKTYSLDALKATEAGSYQTIYEDSESNIYCVKDAKITEVFKYLNGKLNPIGSLPIGGLINGFYEDKRNKILWFATSEGLVKVDKKSPVPKPTYYTTKDGLPGNFIAAIETDSKKRVWVSTNKGIACFKNMDLSDIRSFTLADGILSTEFHMTASLRKRNGDIWFGGANGITIVPEGLENLARGQKPKIQLTSIHINNEPLDPSIRCRETGATNVSQIKQLVLPYKSNTISFEFAVIEYGDPSANQFEYKLEGADDNWIKGNMRNPKFPTYSNLAPNTYRLIVKAANSDGVEGAVEQVIEIKITPPWYATLWARILGAILVLLSLYGLYRLRIAQVEKREKIRRMEAEYKQLAAETETAVLRLQMNPHFIFNSMNSISSYILSKDIETANAYLGRFARLMRTILNLAAKPRIFVADEIEFLEQYIKTEAMRFEQKFEYKIEVDQAIEPDEVLIPTMILQPFVENAIWHGLSSRQGQGMVYIRFEKSGDSLVCSVEDNGKGREAAAAKGKSANHESKALKITERRLQLLSEKMAKPASLEFIDLKDGAGNPTGTRVVVRMPFMEE